MYIAFMNREYKAKTKSLHGGTQSIIRFPNGFGASVINHEGSYGTELAFIRFKGEGDNFDLIYAEPFPHAEVGYINSQEELVGYLEQIKALPSDYLVEEKEN